MKKLIYLVVVLAFGLTAGVASGDVVSGEEEDIVRINFQPQDSEVPEGYIIDYGKNFSPQNGLNYGFYGNESDTLGGTRDRDGAHEDQRYDTHIQLWEGNWTPKSKTWEIALDSGKYNIYIVCGDAVATDQVNTLDIEGTIVLDTDGQDNHDEYTLYDISVTDGLLTVKEADACDVENSDHYAHNSKLHFIHIEPKFLNPIIIDPNVMTAYEDGETKGDFGVSLRNEPPPGATITVTVDPNDGGPSEDFTFIGGDPCDGSITLTFTGKTATDTNSLDLSRGSCADWNPATRTSCWNAPLTVVFKAIDDDIAEPQETGDTLFELHYILVSSAWPEHPTDANYVGQRTVIAKVMDNDQANILFTYTYAEELPNATKFPVIGPGPVQIWEQPRYFWGSNIKWRKIGVTLQVPPSGGDVEIVVTKEGISGNQPIMVPPLTPASEPNCLTFTPTDDEVWDPCTMTSGWNVSQDITIWGVDDDVLQAEGAEAEGDQNYQAFIRFTVVDDGGDTRYTDIDRGVDIDIEDNECGAWGISYLDIVGDPSRVSDPNNPDCYVDIYDIIEFATRWFNCSDPQDAGCESYLD